MAFGKVWLQSQGLISIESRFFPARRYRVGCVIQPALHHGETSKSQSKIWIELDSLFEKRLSFQRGVVEHFSLAGVTMCLDEEQISVWILRRPAIETRFFIWRKLRLKSRGNSSGKIGLDGEDVGQIAVVIFGPNVLVVVGIDQLHVHAHPIADAANAAFQKRGHAKRFANVAGVSHGAAAIRHDRRPRNHFQIADFREVCQNVVLDAVSEIGVFLFIAQIFERQHRDRLVDLAGGSARQEEETGGG